MYFKSTIANMLLLISIIILSFVLWITYTKVCSIILLIFAMLGSVGYVREEFFIKDKSNDKRNSN